MRSTFSIILLAFLPLAAAIFGTVRGVVHDPSHRPVQSAHVTLRSQSSDWSRSSETDDDGGFSFGAVPAGQYEVTIAREGFATLTDRVTVASGSAPLLHLQLSLESHRQSVEVSDVAAGIDPESMTPSAMITRKEIEQTPGADRTNSLAMITNYVPGAFMTHDQLHVRGGHQVTWAVDGVPVPNTNIASNVGPQFDPKDIDYLEAQRGSYSAEWGDRAYGVFNIVPRTGFERNREGELAASFGSFRQTNDQVSFGNHTERFAWYFSANGNRTDLGLETPGSKLVHDRANGYGGFGTLFFNPNNRDQLRLVTALRRDYYQVPGTSDAEHESDAFVNFSWVRSLKPSTLLTVSPFYHFNRADYQGVVAKEDRASTYAGGQVSLSAITRTHNARAGVYAFGQRDSNSLGLALSQKLRSTGALEAVFLEDRYALTHWLSLTGGVRITHFGGSLSEIAVSPRLGGALQIPKLNWVFRAFYGRYYQAPPLSTVSGPILAFALEQGFDFLPLHGERDEERQFGVAIPFHGWTLDGDHFSTRVRNFFDHNVIGNSNIFFPVTVDHARIRGWEVTLRSPRLFQRADIHVAYANLRAEGEGAVSGGLTDFSPPGGRFLLDHDQRHTLSAGFQSNLPLRSWLSGNVNYGSGLADNGGPGHLPHHTTVDLMAGKQVRENWTVSLNATNLANRRFLLDASQTFGGTHYANPREIFAQVRYRFHF
ncbi:MAG: TonB-dependent receptor [Acidobacteriota bacterium]|nr:TonB-dependent receptor [Acidobacteriota bacterium]